MTALTRPRRPSALRLHVEDELVAGDLVVAVTFPFLGMSRTVHVRVARPDALALISKAARLLGVEPR